MKLLVDTDCLFAAYVKHDPNHTAAVALLKEHKQSGDELHITNLVLQEVATVFSYKIGQKESLEFLDDIATLGLIRITIDEDLDAASWKIFKNQTKNKTSFVDCANLTVIEKYKLDGILSFDRFYGDKLIK